MRSCRSLLAAAFLAAASLHATASAPADMAVELLAADASAAAPPADRRVTATVHGDQVQLVLPYRQQGSWLRIVPRDLPAEPRLVVNGVAVGHMTLLLPDGSRVERDKTHPDSDPAASSVAAVFALPAMAPGAELLLHVADRHRSLVDLRVMAAPDWRETERAMLSFAIGTYGAFIAFIIIAGTYWTILRDRMFADHALYLAALVIFMAMTNGLFYVPFHDGLWARLGIQAQWGFATAAIGFAVGFAIRFLDAARHLPRVARVLDALRMALLVAAVAVTFSPVPTPYFSAITGLLLVLINIALLGLGTYIAFQRNRYAAYFLLGWVPLTISTSLRALQGSGLVELRYEMALLFALGPIWEALVLTAGIADRALSFRRERDLARHLAEHDALTGLLNRRAAQARLAELFKRSRHGGASLAVLFLDLDHFKSINDRFGHAGGDAVLVAIAKRIAGQLRGGDVLGRWGGEEFVAILPGAAPEAVRATGERIRRVVESEPVHAEGHLIPVTVSVGLAMLDAASADSAALLQHADEALYRAKDKGRNRVEERVPA